MTKGDAIRYGKALRFVRMAAQTLDEKVPEPDPAVGSEFQRYVETADALDKAAETTAAVTDAFHEARKSIPKA